MGIRATSLNGCNGQETIFSFCVKLFGWALVHSREAASTHLSGCSPWRCFPTPKTTTMEKVLKMTRSRHGPCLERWRGHMEEQNGLGRVCCTQKAIVLVEAVAKRRDLSYKDLIEQERCINTSFLLFISLLLRLLFIFKPQGFLCHCRGWVQLLK